MSQVIYFWSDTHFNHEGILRHCAATRPYPSWEVMNVALLSMWSNTIRPQDTIYLIGDFGFAHSKRSDLSKLFEGLPGHKFLVRGNHDYGNKDAVLKLPWEGQYDLVKVKDRGRRVILCHYPLETWEGAHRGYLHAHGHSHGSLKRVIPHRFDVGVDANGKGGPLSIDRLFSMAAQQTDYRPQDHHAGDM